MSGIVGSKINIRGSGRIAKLGTDGQVLTSAGAGVSAVYEDAAGGGLDWQSVTTGSTLTAVAGNGYPIDTTSNACTITLPASASVGDEIIFTDYDRTWGTNRISFDSNGLNFQGYDDTYTKSYNTDGQSVHIVYMDATNGWISINDDVVSTVNPYNPTGIFYGGTTGSYVATSNILSDEGVIQADVASLGTARGTGSGCEFGTDKGIFGFGTTGSKTGVTNIVSNAGVIAADVAAIGTGRNMLGAATYGKDKGIFFAGQTTEDTKTINLVNNLGVVASDTTGLASEKYEAEGVEYGAMKDTCIFGFGYTHAPGPAGFNNHTNTVTNLGVISADITGVGTARDNLQGCSYGNEFGLYWSGNGSGAPFTQATNIVNSFGTVAADTTASAATGKSATQGCEYGETKGAFAFGTVSGTSYADTLNLVSSIGVMAADVSTVGTGRTGNMGCSFGH